MDVVCCLLAAFRKVVQVICFKKADLSVVSIKFKQLHGLAQQDAVYKVCKYVF
jgi:hypothetical protein